MTESNGTNFSLHLAALKGSLMEFKRVLKLVEHADLKDDTGATPLHCAVKRKNLEVAKFLIESGCELNAKNHAGETPLHCASFERNADAVDLLLNAGADINSVDNDGQTPLHVADSLEVVKLLADSGANLNAKDFDGLTLSAHINFRGMRMEKDHKIMKAVLNDDWTFVTLDSDFVSSHFVGVELHAGLLYLILPDDADIAQQENYFKLHWKISDFKVI